MTEAKAVLSSVSTADGPEPTSFSRVICQHPQTHGPLAADCAHHHLANEHHAHEHTSHHRHHHHAAGHRPKQRRALWLSLYITVAMMLVEFVAGWMTASLMLTSDAVHMLSHAAALGVSLLALVLARRQLGAHFPFGLYRVEVLAALLNGLSLAGFSLWICYEAILRLVHPVAVSNRELIVVAVAGLIVNIVTGIILYRAGYEDLNTRGALLHMLADGFSSVVIVVGAVLMAYTGWQLIDPILSVVVALLIAKWSWSLLREAVLILLERKPDHLDLAAIERELLETFPEIRDIHDLHVWEITTHFHCCSAHIVLEDMRLSETQRLRTALAKHLQQRFGIAHPVLQFEC